MNIEKAIAEYRQRFNENLIRIEALKGQNVQLKQWILELEKIKRKSN